MNYRLIFSLFCLLPFFVACGDDATDAPPEVVVDTTAVATPPPSETGGAPVGDNLLSFDYLRGCDSLVTQAFVYRDSVSGTSYAYPASACLSNRSYEVILLPREGHPQQVANRDPAAEFRKALEGDMSGYRPYAFIAPKLVRTDARTGETVVSEILPANVIVLRYDNGRWNRLGAERVEDAEAMNDLRWNILHDSYPTYN